MKKIISFMLYLLLMLSFVLAPTTKTYAATVAPITIDDMWVDSSGSVKVKYTLYIV